MHLVLASVQDPPPLIEDSDLEPVNAEVAWMLSYLLFLIVGPSIKVTATIAARVRES